MLLLIKLIIDVVCGVFFAIGGDDALYFRRFIMPCGIALGVSISSVWWAWIMVLPVMGTLCIGYSGGHWALRGGWMALQATVVGLGCFLTGHLAIWFYVPYIAAAFAAGATLYKIEQLVGDFVFGLLLTSVIFMVR